MRNIRREAIGPARAWHIDFNTALPYAISLCARFHQPVFVKCGNSLSHGVDPSVEQPASDQYYPVAVSIGSHVNGIGDSLD